jgi:nitrite reductase (NADH) small subunit
MTFACSAADVPPGEGRVALVDGVRVAVFRAGDGWRAVDADCPHRGGPLADGLVADASVTCPLHQRRFSLDTGEALGHDCPALTVHRVAEHDGELYVELRGALRRAA